MLRVSKFSVPVMLALLISTMPVFASTVSYTTLSSFNLATTGVSVEDFEGATLGQLTPGDGTTVGTVGSLSFTANVAGGYGFDVTNIFPTTSGTQYLGSGYLDGTLASQDNFTVTLPSSTAFGLYILVGGPLAAGDFTLSVAGGSAVSSATAEPTSVPYVYFLGLTSDTAFTSATLQVTSPGGAGDGPYWNVDDVRWGTANGTTPPPAVPEPASLVLIGTGLVGVVRRIRKA